jgi:hypothetical protein
VYCSYIFFDFNVIRFVADAQLLKIYLDLFQNSFFKKLFAFVPLWFLLIYRLNNIVNQQEKGFFHVIRGKERIHLSFPPSGEWAAEAFQSLFRHTDGKILDGYGEVLRG